MDKILLKGNIHRATGHMHFMTPNINPYKHLKGLILSSIGQIHEVLYEVYVSFKSYG